MLFLLIEFRFSALRYTTRFVIMAALLYTRTVKYGHPTTGHCVCVSR